jgi:phage gpG-like protein
MPTLSLKLYGIRETLQKLQRLDQGLASFKPELKQTGEFLQDYYIKAPFETEGTIYGSRWPKLSEPYATEKRKKYIAKPILERTGKMRRAFTHEAADHQLVVSNPVPYFKYHQSSAPRTRLPRRQMIGLNDQIISKIFQIFRDSLGRKVKQIFI